MGIGVNEEHESLSTDQELEEAIKAWLRADFRHVRLFCEEFAPGGKLMWVVPSYCGKRGHFLLINCEGDSIGNWTVIAKSHETLRGEQ